MSKDIKEHKHCKECECVIKEPDTIDIAFCENIERYKLSYCDNCLINKGIESLLCKEQEK